MSAVLRDGQALAAAMLAALAPSVAAVRQARGAAPRLAIVCGGTDASSKAYLKSKLKACASAGIETEVHAWPAAGGQGEALGLVANLAVRPGLDGIILEQPLPEGMDGLELLSLLPPNRDVEGVHPRNYGRFFLAKTALELAAPGIVAPCTAAAVMALLAKSGVPPAGREAVVVGRSEILGRPAAHFLSALDATVTLCHSKTATLRRHVERADILVACAGRPELIKGDWIKPGAVVLDAGMNPKGKAWIGDVAAKGARERAAFLTPVPGGVGPVTTAVLLANVVAAAQSSRRP